METPPPPPPIPPVIPNPPPVPAPRGNDKLWSILSHLSYFTGIGFFILPLVVYLVMKNESEYVTCNAREALNFHISLFIYYLCCIPLLFLCLVGWPMMIVISVAAMILSIVAAIKAADGECYRYPLTLRLVQ